MANDTKPLQSKNLGDYKKLGRGSWSSAYRRLAAASGLPKNPGVFERLKAFTSQFSNWGQWFSHVARYALKKRYPFQKYDSPEKGIFQASDPLKLSIAGDWGTGTDEAWTVMQKMIVDKSAPQPDYTIHLGDVYYVGDSPELQEHCLGKEVDPKTRPVEWYSGSKGSFALSGNHEMYARGTAYFTQFLPRMGQIDATTQERKKQQTASYFCLQNNHWKVIGLDTGYNSAGFWTVFSFLSKIKFISWFRKTKWLKPSCKLPDDLIAWLPAALAPNQEPGAPVQGLILLSHHQYYSGFDDWYVRPAKQLKPYIKDRTVLWFWGHEHRMAVYDGYASATGVKAFGRCIGHGGMPVDRGKSPDIKDCPCVLYDDRKYDNDEGIDVGYNGYANLTLDGPRLQVDYLDLNNTVVLTEHWSVNAKGKLAGPTFSSVSANSGVMRDEGYIQKRQTTPK